MTDDGFFDPKYLARSTDPETSKERAERENRRVPKQWEELEPLYESRYPDGLTYREAANATGTNGTSISSTISTLLKCGKLEEAGYRRNGMKVRRLKRNGEPDGE